MFPVTRSDCGIDTPRRISYPLLFITMRPTTSFKQLLTLTAKLSAASALAAAIALPAAGPAAADPMTVCPPNQSTYWNGQPCFPQPCVPPYAPGIPPCFMPPPQIGPNGIPVFG